MKRIRPHSSKGSAATEKRLKKETLMRRMFIVTLLMAVVAVCAQYFYHNYIYLPGLISQKTSLPVLDLNLDRKMWGTYRSHLYFGLRTPHPQSPLFGLIWYQQPYANIMVPPVRHWCDQKEGIRSFGWTLADGRSFGRQTIYDTSFELMTDWINSRHTWTARIYTHSTSAQAANSKIALVFYLMMQDSESFMEELKADDRLQTIKGYSQLLGNFTMRFVVSKESIDDDRSFLAQRAFDYPDATKIKEAIIAATEVDRAKQLLRLPNRYVTMNGDETESASAKTKLIAVQITLPMNTSVEISFENDESKAPKGKDFDEVLRQRSETFTEKFETIYGLTAKAYSGFYQYMGRLALSNMLGSIAYTSGYNRVQSPYSSQPTQYGFHELFTTCPSRSTFPRGFLWDEGFHHLLIRKFDPELSLQIISSWLNTMNIDGWIPREMILSKEDEMLVPAEFLIQRDTIANPPMFFYLIQRFLDDKEFIATHRQAVLNLYPRLRLWHSWLNSTQTGPRSGTYRWHGRNATTVLELNPKTLPSGLDDYPRATHPTNEEYHLDLRSWMAVAAKTLSQLAKLYSDDEQATVYTADASYLNDLNVLNNLHWSDKAQCYCDYGLHSRNVVLQRRALNAKNEMRAPNPNLPPAPPPPPPPKVRVVNEEPVLGFVDNTYGYLSLYPLMLKLLPHDCDNLRILLENLRSEKDLWSKYGLRSISAQSPYYKAYNTEHDPPYWRGAVWINMNYMVLSALKHYSSIAGPIQELAFQIYSDLRNNVVSNMVREFKRSGYLWENYNDENGEGRGAHPFTGWSSLVLSIMAEQYD